MASSVCSSYRALLTPEVPQPTPWVRWILVDRWCRKRLPRSKIWFRTIGPWVLEREGFLSSVPQKIQQVMLNLWSISRGLVKCGCTYIKYTFRPLDHQAGRPVTRPSAGAVRSPICYTFIHLLFSGRCLCCGEPAIPDCSHIHWSS